MTPKQEFHEFHERLTRLGHSFEKLCEHYENSVWRVSGEDLEKFNRGLLEINKFMDLAIRSRLH